MDPMTMGMVAQTAGSLIGGAMQAGSVNDTNARNATMAREQQAFQERMSNTAHQREVADLRAAGLNPILSATGGSGASAPSGSMSTAQAPDKSFVGNAIRDSVSSALSVKQQAANVANTSAETLNKLETAKVLGEDIRGKRASNARSEATIDNDIEKNLFERNRAMYDTRTAEYGSHKAMTEADRARTRLAVEKADAPRSINQSKTDNATLRYQKAIDMTKDVLDGASSAASIVKPFVGRGSTPSQSRGSRRSPLQFSGESDYLGK